MPEKEPARLGKSIWLGGAVPGAQHPIRRPTGFIRGQAGEGIASDKRQSGRMLNVAVVGGGWRWRNTNNNNWWRHETATPFVCPNRKRLSPKKSGRKILEKRAAGMT